MFQHNAVMPMSTTRSSHAFNRRSYAFNRSSHAFEMIIVTGYIFTWIWLPVYSITQPVIKWW